jgi:hypothetical protein
MFAIDARDMLTLLASCACVSASAFRRAVTAFPNAL